jgi:ABC-2 type transport system ATP-binding protein
MLELQDVTKSFKDLNAVDGVSLRLEPGVVGLIGHNGAGKTTLMQMIATLAKPSRGRILFDGAATSARSSSCSTSRR